MLIAQITDLHLGFEPDNPFEFNYRRLDATVDMLLEGPNRPDMLLATGDLTEHGDGDSFRRVRDMLSRCPFPVYPIVGNHDRRDNMLAHFPDTPVEDGFIQYAVETERGRILMLDTLEEGRHGGAFCERRARWLADQLASAPDRPTIIVMHHPPVEIGIPWMNTDPAEPWVARFSEVIEGHMQIVSILCGHVHRAISAPWRGTTVSICPSTAPQVALDMNPMSTRYPDGRMMVVAGPPGFALHRWTETGLVSHFESVEDHVPLAHYDESLAGMVKNMLAERPDGSSGGLS